MRPNDSMPVMRHVMTMLYERQFATHTIKFKTAEFTTNFI